MKGARRPSGSLSSNALESSFPAHIEIFRHHLSGFAVRPKGKSDAASAHGVLALRLVREGVAIVMFHGEGHFFRTLHDRQAAILFDDGILAEEIVRVFSKISGVISRGRNQSVSSLLLFLHPGENAERFIGKAFRLSVLTNHECRDRRRLRRAGELHVKRAVVPVPQGGRIFGWTTLYFQPVAIREDFAAAIEIIFVNADERLQAAVEFTRLLRRRRRGEHLL